MGHFCVKSADLVVKKIWSSWKLFISVGNQKKIIYNFNTATHAYGGLKNIIIEKKFDRVPQLPALNGINIYQKHIS
jgi:hypothetical protein